MNCLCGKTIQTRPGVGWNPIVIAECPDEEGCGIWASGADEEKAFVNVKKAIAKRTAQYGKASVEAEKT